MMWLFEQYRHQSPRRVFAGLGQSLGALRRHRPAANLARGHRAGARPAAPRHPVGVGLRRRRGRLDEARRLGANGGTLVAIGTAVETARELLDLPIEKALPESSRRLRVAGAGEAASSQVPASEIDRVLRQAFSSPANLLNDAARACRRPSLALLLPGVIAAERVRYDAPGRLRHASTRGRSSSRATRRTGCARASAIDAEVVARYPKQGAILQSGWLLGEDLLRDQANIVAFRVGKGYVVAAASQIDFRAQPRGDVQDPVQRHVPRAGAEGAGGPGVAVRRRLELGAGGLGARGLVR